MFGNPPFYALKSFHAAYAIHKAFPMYGYIIKLSNSSYTLSMHVKRSNNEGYLLCSQKH